MTPKQRVAVMTAIFAAFGIGVSVVIIAAGGGFSGSGPSIFNPPTSADIWVVGDHINNGTELEYTLTSKTESSELDSARASMSYSNSGNDWKVKFVVVNGTSEPVEKTIMMSKELTREGELDDSFKPYFDPIQSSIFHVREMEYGQSPKYLVESAPWDEIYYQSSKVIVRVTGKEQVQTPAGTFEAFVLSYKLAENTSKIWVVKDKPLPVKAQVFDSDDKLQYQYELVRAV